jgi:hypothetical protein
MNNKIKKNKINKLPLKFKKKNLRAFSWTTFMQK